MSKSVKESYAIITTALPYAMVKNLLEYADTIGTGVSEVLRRALREGWFVEGEMRRPPEFRNPPESGLPNAEAHRRPIIRFPQGKEEGRERHYMEGEK